MSEELKPCPFCGGPAEIQTEGRVCRMIGCRDCGGSVGAVDLERGYWMWNRRTPAEQPAPASTGRDYDCYNCGGKESAHHEGCPAVRLAARELDVEAERREFEAWARAEGYDLLRDIDGPGYFYCTTDSAWSAWQARAARSAAQGTAPSNSLEFGGIAPVSTEQAGDAWISVEDRLPDESLLRFLVTGRAVSGGPLGVHIATLYDGDMYFEGAAESGGCNPCINDVVTHWMPLPGAPSPNNSPVGADRRE